MPLNQPFFLFFWGANREKIVKKRKRVFELNFTIFHTVRHTTGFMVLKLQNQVCYKWFDGILRINTDVPSFKKNNQTGEKVPCHCEKVGSKKQSVL